MLTYTGKYNSANVMVDEIDDETVKQIYNFLNHPAFAHTYIAIMPDCHAGAGAVVGFTAKMNNYVIPNVVGVDIGCGVLAYNLGHREFKFEDLDNFIKEKIPSGFAHRNKPVVILDKEFLDSLNDVCVTTNQDFNKVKHQLGTLGGGNHFIELELDDLGNHWLVVHSGSRNFGLQVANFYQRKAKELLKQFFHGADTFKSLEYLPIDLGGKEYLNDMKVAQRFAQLNRTYIALEIMNDFFKCSYQDKIESIHNYINFEDNTIRKGAVSAHENERLIIPFNMKDGVAICTGKGNKKWNYSAPHGAGRIMSRTKAKKELILDEFTSDMDGIYTTTAMQNTIDESPRAYKETLGIIMAISETVNIEQLIKPIYNFKAGGD